MEFTKHDAGKLKRVGSSWRLPRGKKNRDRLQRRGHRKLPQEGFRRAREERGKINGKEVFLLHSLSEISQLNQDNIVIISSSVGKRKREALLKACTEKGIEVLNHGVTKNTEKGSQ